MKIGAFTIIIFFLLLCGGHHFYACNSYNQSSQISSETISKNHPVKFTNKIHNCIIIEESEIDLEEEYAKPNDFKNLNYNRITSEKFMFLNKWHSILYNHYIFNIPSKDSKNFPPLCGKSNPIYITQRVLRI